MANRTDPLAQQVHGCNPQTLVSRIIRRKIYESVYWKEQCFALTAETVLEPCVALTYVGGTYGGKRQPAPFLCLVLKLLQIQPETEVVLEFIKQEQFKYLRAVGAFYLRLVGRASEVYTHLEPLLADYRKLRFRLPDGKFAIVCMDEFVDDCLRKTNFLDVDLPVLPKREVLENEGDLPPTRLTALEHDVEVYAPAGVAGGEGVSERDQQLWLLQKEQLREEQKKLQRRVLQQRMKQKQQEQEQLLLQQVRELEIENGGPDRGDKEKQRSDDAGDGWWKEKKEPGDKERDRERGEGADGVRRQKRRNERDEGEEEREKREREWHLSGRAHGPRGYEGRGHRTRVGSRSPTPVIKREKDDRREDERRRRSRREEEDAERRRRRHREEEEERQRRRDRRRWEEEEERERRRRDRREERDEDEGGDRGKRRRFEDEKEENRRERRDDDDRYRRSVKHEKERDEEERRRHTRDGERRGDRNRPDKGDAERAEDGAKGPAFSFGKESRDRKKGNDDSLSVQEWDALRAQLGLKPLKK
ncbi:putative PRP38 family domain-containing protein [Neospora caninum Liverpool]|uniref:Pre-mRNA-splicing factor 38 n=1 Tax=Neospora caninum (strain Liverpool) TaxID=572307 RepID=F0VM92_NEOCL|nr:putative PRP38 family domain-containing protein [Neospora caninum Liverpool]CBZ54370.1 putative PRP38 family domain-containing protein [Neospora caninum Liverpool]CEL69076.1 TPA: PRP38 family domain-containing protein, putative [Neospora caninum Liverpool]|eukprot:XP_003884400.1 putative PRP38 family domain-containing protein [Neospora caninum Liverpool]